LAAREKELVGNYIREHAHDVGVQFYLPEGQLNVVCMGNYIEVAGNEPLSFLFASQSYL
jgi:hypothetical protein